MVKAEDGGEQAHICLTHLVSQQPPARQAIDLLFSLWGTQFGAPDLLQPFAWLYPGTTLQNNMVIDKVVGARCAVLWHEVDKHKVYPPIPIDPALS